MPDRRVRHTVVVTALAVTAAIGTAVVHHADRAAPPPSARKGDEKPARSSAPCTVPRGPYELHASAARLRARPSLRAKVLGMVYPHQRLDITRERAGWVGLTDRTSGLTGWVSGRLVFRTPGKRSCE